MIQCVPSVARLGLYIEAMRQLQLASINDIVAQTVEDGRGLGSASIQKKNVKSYSSMRCDMNNSALNNQEGGSHYKTLKIQPIEYIHANNIGYLEGNVIKYVTRHESKNGVEDINKAIHYLQLIKELKYGG
ncbi:hypothetical protein [Pseudomonas phage PSA11]|nr:hypothetical protein [Pseudomonas phage PSA11]